MSLLAEPLAKLRIDCFSQTRMAAYSPLFSPTRSNIPHGEMWDWNTVEKQLFKRVFGPLTSAQTDLRMHFLHSTMIAHAL